MSGPDLNVRPQLKWRRWFARDDSATEGSRNCACAVGAALVEWATRGAQRPTHHAFRVAADANQHPPSGLSSDKVHRAYKSFGVDSTLMKAQSFDEVRKALRAGHAISACIDYGSINDNPDAVGLSGQKTFRTGHHVALLGFTANDPRTKNQNSTTVYDPLFDGRTRFWGTAPRGPQLAPLPVYRDAMADLRVGGHTYAEGHRLGNGRATFLIIKQDPEQEDNPDEEQDMPDDDEAIEPDA